MSLLGDTEWSRRGGVEGFKKIDTQMELPMSSRPGRYREEVFVLASKKILSDMKPWYISNYCNSERDLEELRIGIYDCIKHLRSNLDGYSLAVRLSKDMSIEPDAELVDILDSASSHMYTSHLTLISEWVKSTGLKLEFKEGDTVYFDHEKIEYKGTVYTLHSDTGRYVVNCKSLGHTDLDAFTGTRGKYLDAEEVRKQSKKELRKHE